MKTKRRRKYNKKSYRKKSFRKKYLKRAGGPHDSCVEEDIEELKDRIYQELLNVNLYTKVELLYEKKNTTSFSYLGETRNFTKTIHLPSNMKNIKIKIVVSIYINDFYGAMENYIVKTQIIFCNDTGGIYIDLDKIIYKPAMYYENIFYDDVINRLANILITRYHECQPKSKSKSQVNNERFYAISSETNFYKILDIDKTANSEEIKKAYKEASLICHPDMHLNRDRKEDAENNFKKVVEAYRILSDPEKRKIYDSEYHNRKKNVKPKEKSEIRIKRKTMEETALRERSIIVLSKRFRDTLYKRRDKKRAKLEATRKAEEKAEREAQEKAEREAEEEATRAAEEEFAREAIQKAKKEAKRERKEKNKEKTRVRMQTVKNSLLFPIMLTRKKKDISQEEVAPYNPFTSTSQLPSSLSHPPSIRLSRPTRRNNSSVPTTRVYI